MTSSLDACDIANRIQESGMVKFSHPNFTMPVDRHQVIPSDTYFNNQFYLRNTGQVFNPIENHSGLANADINASFAWNTTLGANAIIVAVIDEGLTPNHPDLPNTRQVRLNGSNFVPGENANNPTPGLNNNHGNSCAGIIAATHNNNEGVSGIVVSTKIHYMKKFLMPLLMIAISLSCKKSKLNTCEYDMCDSRRKTIMTATNWSGPLGYYNDIRKWAVNVPIQNTIDGLRTCIICADIPDSLKTIGKIVTFSGELKESCDNPKPALGGQEIYFVNATNIR